MNVNNLLVGTWMLMRSCLDCAWIVTRENACESFQCLIIAIGIGFIGHAGIHPIGPAVREIITRAIRNVRDVELITHRSRTTESSFEIGARFTVGLLFIDAPEPFDIVNVSHCRTARATRTNACLGADW